MSSLPSTWMTTATIFCGVQESSMATNFHEGKGHVRNELVSVGKESFTGSCNVVVEGAGAKNTVVGRIGGGVAVDDRIAIAWFQSEAAVVHSFWEAVLAVVADDVDLL